MKRKRPKQKKPAAKQKPKIRAIFLDFEGVVTKMGTVLHTGMLWVVGDYVSYEELNRRYYLAREGKISFREYMQGVPKRKQFGYLKYVKYSKGAKKSLGQLSKKYPLYLASNHIHVLFEKELELLGARRYFKRIFVSYKMQKAKPSKEFFRHMLKKTGLRAKECIFVDDAKRNLVPAQEMGFTTVWMNNRTSDARNKFKVKPDFEVKSLNGLVGAIRELG